jgi:hypothetical protein
MPTTENKIYVHLEAVIFAKTPPVWCNRPNFPKRRLARVSGAAQIGCKASLCSIVPEPYV